MDSHGTIAPGYSGEQARYAREPQSEQQIEIPFGERPPVPFEAAQADPPPESDDSVAKFTWEQKTPCSTVIKVLGVGGGGCNAVENMVNQGFDGVEFYAINTDFMALQRCEVPNRIQIGDGLTHGSGAGAIPSIGEQSAREAEEKIRDCLTGADMVFITAGLGGGTGTGAAPVVAEIARSMNILNVAIVTKPFTFEGVQRMRRAQEGAKLLSEHTDTMISILNDKLMEVVGPKTPLTEAFQVANQVLAQGIRAISDLIALPGLINVDFRDVRTIMGETGGAVMGVGIGRGENRSVEAVRKACHSPLQEKIVIDGARGILINITGPSDITMHEINEATSLVYEMADPEANVIFGVVIDENMNDSMRVTIIATGFSGAEGAEGFIGEQGEKLRPRPDPLMVPSPSGRGLLDDAPELGSPGASAASSSTQSAAPAEVPSPRPAIMNKREREARSQTPPVDFKSNENPMKEWDKPSAAAPAAEPAAAAIEPVVEPAQTEAREEAPRVLEDSAPEPREAEAPAGEVDTPAIRRRRRRPRFFESE